MTPDLILPYEGVWPVLAAEPRHCGAGSAVVGAVRLGARAWLGAGCVVRADGETVTIGDDAHLGANATVHIATDTLATTIGARASVGRNAVVHACRVGADVCIEADCVVLDGACVEDGVLIEAGSIVFPRARLTAGTIYAGCPAKPQGPITPAALAERAARLRADGASDRRREAASSPAPTEGTAFVARTARVSGPVTLGAGATVLFSCRLDAAGGTIRIGADSNVQDNSVIEARGAGVVIGRETTIGHNVRLADCRVGAGSLIGIGCVLAPGTVVADDVLLAAGATTEPGQLIGSGHLWGGRPARILGPLDDDKRRMMARTVQGYRAHGETYRRLEAAPA